MLLGFCTFADQDEIQPTPLTPWIGFVYIFPEARGKRLSGLLLAEAERLAREMGAPCTYISTDHVGLYERFGYAFTDMQQTVTGEASRVYGKHLG